MVHRIDTRKQLLQTNSSHPSEYSEWGQRNGAMAYPFPLPAAFMESHDFEDPRLSQLLRLKSTEPSLSNTSSQSLTSEIPENLFKQKVTEDYHDSVQELNDYEMEQLGPNLEGVDNGRGNHATMNRSASGVKQQKERKKRTSWFGFEDGSVVVPTLSNAHVVGSFDIPTIIGPDNEVKQLTTLDRSPSISQHETEARYARERGYRVNHTERESLETGRAFSYVNSPAEYAERLEKEGGVVLPYSIARFSFQDRKEWELSHEKAGRYNRNSTTVTHAPNNTRSSGADFLGSRSASARASKSTHGAKKNHNDARASESSQGVDKPGTALASGTHLTVAGPSTARGYTTDRADRNSATAHSSINGQAVDDSKTAPGAATDPALGNLGAGPSSATANRVDTSTAKPTQIFMSKYNLIKPDGTYIGYGGIVHRLPPGVWTDRQVEAWEKFLHRRQDLMIPNTIEELLTMDSDDGSDDSDGDGCIDNLENKGGVKAKGSVKENGGDEDGVKDIKPYEYYKTKATKSKTLTTKEDGNTEVDSLVEIEVMLGAPAGKVLPSKAILSPPGGIPFTEEEEADIKEMLVQYWDDIDRLAVKGRGKPVTTGPFHREIQDNTYQYRFKYKMGHGRYVREAVAAGAVGAPARAPVRPGGPTLLDNDDEPRPIRPGFGWGWNHLDDMFVYFVVFVLLVLTIVTFFVDSEPVRRSAHYHHK
ncbi:hypothetical protein BDZ45DRAFT_683841 [Acephala macrosclerotiorum]|nr:hypothetical protein BDZ45DRAFT_683841 [Acephala macrosclerotiorum]